MHAREMIGTHPAVQGQINDALIRCIEECYSCAQTCTSCADACLSERMVQELTQCIRLDLDCADICNITGRILTRRTGYDDEVMRRMLSVCAAACRLRSARRTLPCMNIAASVRKAAAAAWRPARRCHAAWRNRIPDQPSRLNTLNWKICRESHGVACSCRCVCTSLNAAPSVRPRLALS